MPAVPERIRHAVDLLAPRAGETVLEVGGGTGVAAALVLARVGAAGRLVALDRSAAAVERTVRRLPDAVAEGRLRPVVAALEDAPLEPASVDAALAVNVNLFWTRAAVGVAALRRVLRPSGRLVVVIEPPAAARAAALADACARNLAAGGFTVVASGAGAEGPLVSLVATPAAPPRPDRR